jgi:peptidoglycan/LPS O-acetylase OafA/YrhL
VIAVIIIANFSAPSMIAWWQLLAFVIALPSLFSLTRYNKIDRMIGDLSYPVYIMHYPLYILIRNMHISKYITLGSAVAIVAIVIGCIVYFCIDQPIDRWRHKLIQNAPTI